MNTDQILHIGVVTNLEDSKAIVRLEQPEECGSCHMKGICGVNEEDSKYFEVDAQNLTVGDEVSLEIQPSVGFEAIFWAYLLPFFLIVLVIIGGTVLNIGDQWIGLVSLFSLLPYYFLLSRYKKILKSHLDLKVIKHE